ncbi:hypothetical protein JOY44_30370 (plasmid) [Phormidium sp. CLA17]|uniref:hypothetical protein n=1 Tax=Leptolyngbya sp. Cla-17 TaxID=2803751 RepID=UPI001492C07E|nr:hypothetical protein [Leptolyngbya sp. Cla-17]MBM0745723.1 hypothetical protein [Leptolyngbya sp. Cla-17]
MNLAKLILLACPVVLTSMLMEAVPAHAFEAATPLQVPQVNVAQTAVDHLNLTASNLRSDQPLIPTGCGCTQCFKAEQLLQGRLPGF